MKRAGMATVYMKVTKDEYELPVAIADSIAELAKMLGVTRQHIYDSMRHAKQRGHKTPYIKVEIEKEN